MHWILEVTDKVPYMLGQTLRIRGRSCTYRFYTSTLQGHLHGYSPSILPSMLYVSGIRFEHQYTVPYKLSQTLRIWGGSCTHRFYTSTLRVHLHVYSPSILPSILYISGIRIKHQYTVPYKLSQTLRIRGRSCTHRFYTSTLRRAVSATEDTRLNGLSGHCGLDY